MRVFIDTNVLISAALFPSGAASRAYLKAVSVPCDPVVSDYVIDELRRVFSRKFPQRMKALDAFIAALSSTVSIVVTPEGKMSDEAQVRDVNDRPILRAARAAGVDVLVTGDKDFLDSTVDNPRILSPSEFLLL